MVFTLHFEQQQNLQIGFMRSMRYHVEPKKIKFSMPLRIKTYKFMTFFVKLEQKIAIFKS